MFHKSVLAELIPPQVAILQLQALAPVSLNGSLFYPKIVGAVFNGPTDISIVQWKEELQVCVHFGTLVPTSLQPLCSLALEGPAPQSVMPLLQGHSPVDLCSLQEADPLLRDHFLCFWRRQAKPTSKERQQLPTSVDPVTSRSWSPGHRAYH